MKRTKFHILVVYLGAFCVAQINSLYARAAESSELAPPLFETRYFKEGDPNVTTSKCIGNPITPLCAAETWLNSLSYKDDQLGEIAYGMRPGTIQLITKPPYNPVTFCYQIRGYWHFLEDDEILKKNNAFAAGDVGIQIVHGHMNDGKCNLYLSGLHDMGLLLRKGRFGWFVINNHPMIDYVRRPEFYTNKNK